MNDEAAVAAKWLALITFSVACSTLAGCGGGGGSDDPTPTASLTLDPTTITVGQSAKLDWSASPGTSCTASGAWSGTQQASGTLEVTPTAAGASTYTLICSGAGFAGSATGSATLTVQAASAYTITPLVEDFAGNAARTTDPVLVNPWGLAYGPTTGIWVANNHSESSSIYDGNGRPSPLVAHFAPGASFDPTGIVFNGTRSFVVGAGTQTGPAAFIFAGEGGMIAAWAPALNTPEAVTVFTASDGAVYKGLAIASSADGDFLYATDFANGKIDVLDAMFTKQPATAATFAFSDPSLPAGYGPFGIQAIKNGAGGATQIYVSYAKHDASEPNDDAPGAGWGLVNVFDSNGNLLKHLVAAGGHLNAPWGMALAPADFGTLSNALLVGNFGDGAIHGYDPASGRYLGALGDGNDTPFVVQGLWGLAFGNDAANQPHATLFFAAGINDEANGFYGRVDLGRTAPALGEPPVLTILAPQGDLGGTVELTANAQSLSAIATVQFFANGGTLIGADTTEPFTVDWDTTTVADGSATLRAVATDVSGNVGSSKVLTVTIVNAAAATTLTQLQQTVFTPRCTTCHDGSQPAGGSLPGAMDLRAGNSFANLVNVASREQPALMRVKPGQPADSYVIHKLEGAADIAGARMPFGGPFLDAATIDQVRSWIASGAPSN